MRSNCDISLQQNTPSNWAFEFEAVNKTDYTSKSLTTRVEYCLAEQITPSCMVELVPSILITIIVCNAIKIGCFVLILRLRNFQPLVTIRDAIASFLDNDDSHTSTEGSMPRRELQNQLETKPTERSYCKLDFIRRFNLTRTKRRAKCCESKTLGCDESPVAGPYFSPFPI
jgi:hypothetical protein